MLLILTAIAILALVYGSAQRYRWAVHLDVGPRWIPSESEGDSCRHLVALVTGAFNGDPHTVPIVDVLKKTSNVTVFSHPLRLFDMARQVTRLYAYLRELDQVEGRPNEHRYDSIVILGFSLGGLMALMFAVRDFFGGRYFKGRLGVIGADSPLMAEHLRVPLFGMPVKGWLVDFAQMLTSLRPGPVWNFLFRPIMWLVFQPVPEAEWGQGVDRGLFKRHMAILRRTPLSLFLSQTAAIVERGPIPREALAGVPAWYIKCGGEDIVIDAEASLDGWKDLFGRTLPVLTVPDSGHILCVENPNAWSAAALGAVSGVQVRLGRKF